MATQDLGAIVRQMYDAWNAKDLDRCVSFSHPDAKITTMPFGLATSIREYVENWARAFPDGRIEVRDIVVQGDRAVAEFTGRGTQTGSMRTPNGELPPSGRRVELACVECLRFRDGKVAESRAYFDAFSLFTQLGVGAMQGREASAGMPQGGAPR